MIRDRDREYIAAYSQALLNCSAHRRVITACPVAFGEAGVRSRIKTLLNYKKPTFWVIAASIIVCAVVAVCFLTDPIRRITLPANPVVFKDYDNLNGYMEMHWEEKGLIYVPYMAIDPQSVGDCIGYDEYDGEFASYVCKVGNLSETEWICDVSANIVNGHTVGMIMREINVKKVPEGWESEYEWNIPYTDYDKTATYTQSENDTEYIISDGFTATEQNITEHYYFPQEANSIGLSMIATDVTPTGCTLVFSQSGGNVTGELQTGQWYELHVKENENYDEWAVYNANGVIAWHDIAYIIKKDDVTEMKVSWEQFHGALPDGHYRIAKRVMDYRGPGDYDEHYVFAEFVIGEF